MTNRNFEDIDKLFREGLHPKEEPLAFQEADWSKLKKRLDRNENRKRGIFWISRLSGVAALILLFFAIRMLVPESQEQILQQAEVQQKDQKIKEELYQQKISPEDKKTASQTVPDSKLLTKYKHSEEQSFKNQILVRSSERETPANDIEPVEILSLPKETEAPRVNLEESIPSQPDIVRFHDQKQSSIEESIIAAIEEPKDKPKPERSIRKLALSVLAAPNYTGVNNLNNAILGNDFGLMVTVKIAKNWSFSTGGIYAKKLYDTGYRNYTPTNNIWTESYPRYVNADCRVLDIPLNINYTFLNRKNTTMSIGSGMSSYMMLREDYRFSYSENGGNNPETYQVVNENQHWLSVLNLQANFDQRLNSRLSIGLQPYMKIPLNNIGFAGVKLQSLGMAANLSWNFNL